MSHPWRVLYHMVKADFLERVRRYSFLVILAYRGVYNSAWIGMLMAINCSTFLSLCGFYVVKNSVERDSQTRVGRILAATPKVFYTVAKTVSNFAVLASMVLVLMAAAVAMQWLRPEARPISLWELWSPFLLVTLPAMFITGSLALLFETLPVLRGGVGNVIYFFVWTFEIAGGAEAHINDLAGINILSTSTQQALARLDPSGKITKFNLTIGGDHASRTFLWNGVDWTPRLVAGRLLWLAVGLGVAALASVFFHRFDPAREKIREKKVKVKSNAAVDDAAILVEPGAPKPAHATLTPLGARGHSRFARLVLSELSLMVKGLQWWWYAVAAGLLVAEFLSPTAQARQGVLLAAWIWPALVWSRWGAASHVTLRSR
jgi:hypothetical protein